jgi:hypothetical protein
MNLWRALPWLILLVLILAAGLVHWILNLTMM